MQWKFIDSGTGATWATRPSQGFDTSHDWSDLYASDTLKQPHTLAFLLPKILHGITNKNYRQAYCDGKPAASLDNSYPGSRRTRVESV